MRRIEFIAPVEAMRGNLSGNQDLKYAEHMNPAFDAPDGRQYAKNYQPRYIGAKRAASGLKYFNTKTRSASNISDASKLNMALLGGTQAIYAAIIHNADFYEDVKTCYSWYTEHGVTKTLRQWILERIRQRLALKAATIVFTGGTGTPTTVAVNPWGQGGSGTALDIDNNILVKFWGQLQTDPVIFTLAKTYKGVCFENMTWSALVAAPFNVLGISVDTSVTPNVVKFAGKTIAEGGEAVATNDEIEAKDYDLI